MAILRISCYINDAVWIPSAMKILCWNVSHGPGVLSYSSKYMCLWLPSQFTIIFTWHYSACMFDILFLIYEQIAIPLAWVRNDFPLFRQGTPFHIRCLQYSGFWASLCVACWPVEQNCQAKVTVDVEMSIVLIWTPAIVLLENCTLSWPIYGVINISLSNKESVILIMIFITCRQRTQLFFR